ncbi:restriction endonuclease [Nitrosopumilus sp. b3]|uniref:ATP cone domain-containing protein n=1 Tax=Nitrosopumilus sp. b3 TaxID=2109909 RepID=UPI001C70B8E1|nr:ATP cone domain-containing protein [Nitrosopumilus sp. b3]KAF6246253.1 restriction endonuclease [Nitrosopumilus sp. b3]
MKKIHIIKADGRRVLFDPNKIIRTCVRAGTSRKDAKKIANDTMNLIHSGFSTKDVYRIVLKNISKINRGNIISHKYRLKESIMKMGPAGFPFESFISQILSNYGYEIEGVRKEIHGKCGKHEIDVIAKLKDKRFMVECKYHHRRGIHTSLKESLYTHARFLDLRENFDEEILSCNTKLSDDALEYATCIGQNLLCWKHPSGESLEKMIDKKGLYPITLLNLNKIELRAFSDIKFMIAKDLLTADLKQLSRKTHISLPRLKRLQDLVGEILI